jgi:hypothetical protein
MTTTTCFEFISPCVHELPYDDDPNEMYQYFAFDIPDAAIRYRRATRLDATIEPGSIRWDLDWELKEFLVAWATETLAIEKTPKGYFKKTDREYLERCLDALQHNIRADLQTWLEKDRRYAELIRDRVNETIADIANRRKVKLTD